MSAVRCTKYGVPVIQIVEAVEIRPEVTILVPRWLHESDRSMCLHQVV